MSKEIENIITEVLQREGGYVNRKDDKGGPTKYGVTLGALESWRGKKQKAEDVQFLTEDEARAIYRNRYVVAPGFADMPDPLRGLLVDCAVHHGPGAAARWLQRAVGAVPDGEIGDETRSLLAKVGAGDAYRRVLGSRIRLFGRLLTDNPRQCVFAAGWLGRAAEFVERVP